jgi:hypothetical protein
VAAGLKACAIRHRAEACATNRQLRNPRSTADPARRAGNTTRRARCPAARPRRPERRPGRRADFEEQRATNATAHAAAAGPGAEHAEDRLRRATARKFCRARAECGSNGELAPALGTSHDMTP